jgi:hypothetical protein
LKKATSHHRLRLQNQKAGGSLNTEFFTIEGNKIKEIEVYFGSAPKEPA